MLAESSCCLSVFPVVRTAHSASDCSGLHVREGGGEGCLFGIRKLTEGPRCRMVRAASAGQGELVPEGTSGGSWARCQQRQPLGNRLQPSWGPCARGGQGNQEAEGGLGGACQQGGAPAWVQVWFRLVFAPNLHAWHLLPLKLPRPRPSGHSPLQPMGPPPPLPRGCKCPRLDFCLPELQSLLHHCRAPALGCLVL